MWGGFGLPAGPTGKAVSGKHDEVRYPYEIPEELCAMTLRNIPIDQQRLSGWLCTSLPEARTDIHTGEARTDLATGQPLYLVGILVKVAGERRAYVLDVQVPGEPTGLVEGRPVVVEGLEAAPWERDGRAGVVYRATAIRPDPQIAIPVEPAPASPAATSRTGSGTGRATKRGGGTR